MHISNLFVLASADVSLTEVTSTEVFYSANTLPCDINRGGESGQEK